MEEEKHLIADIPQKALIVHHGKVLVVRDAKGHWQLPGGRMNEGEEPKEGLLRELQEELGAEVDITGIYDTFVFQSASGLWHYVVVYICMLVSDPASLRDLAGEAQEMKWIGSAEEISLLENDTHTMWSGYKKALETYFEHGTKFN